MMEIDLTTGEVVSKPEPTNRDNLTHDEFLREIREYAETVPIDVDLDNVTLEISTKMKRAAAKTIMKTHRRTGAKSYRIRFAWHAYQAWGWGEQMEGIIRHELVHLWEYQTHNSGGHGLQFKLKADSVNAPRHCEAFADHNYEIVCSNCGKVVGRRYKKSKIVKHPERYTAKCCRAPLKSRTA